MEEQIKIFGQNAETFIGADELREKLANGKKLRVKLGVDPTRPDLTFGHMVVFNKLRQFQDLGHRAVLIIGDYTACIGDPSGRSIARPVLTAEEVAKNAETYLEQAFKVLNREQTEVHYNSEWLSKMTFGDTLDLARKMTVARMLERDDFAKRYATKTPISIVEFLYPLMQGHDSVMIESDVELGGSDQLFNNLVGRDLQKEAGLSPQAVITMPLLVGLDGEKKMSKSYGNYIAFNDSPKDMFGKIMSISDETMWVYYKFLMLYDDAVIARLKSEHPMSAKKKLACLMVARFYGVDAGRIELEHFEKVFSKNEIPENMSEFQWDTLSGAKDDEALVNIMCATSMFQSKKDIRRLIEQGGVKIDSQKISDPFLAMQRPLKPIVIQVGKRIFFRVLP